MSYWLSDNRQYAEQSTLHQLTGFLKSAAENGDTYSPQKLLELMAKWTEEELERLNKVFPEKAPINA